MHESDHPYPSGSLSSLNSWEGKWPAYEEYSRFESASQEVAQHVEVALEMARTAALSAMAVACQGVVDVAYPSGNVVPTSLHLLTIAETGERKTALENWFFNPIKYFQKTKKAESEHAQKAYQRELKNWQTGERILNKAWAKAFENEELAEEIEQRQAKHDAKKPQPPCTYQLIYENVTPIALAYGLYENLPMACLLSSEAGSILEGKAMEDLPMFNSIWSGTPLEVTRRSSPSFTLNDPRLTMALMAQPKVIDRFLEKRGEEAKDNGFLSRLLVIKPTSMIGKREGKGRAVNSATMERFNERVTTLLDKSLDILARDDRQRRVLEFTPSAKERWQEIHLSIEQAMVEHGKYYHARGHGSKLMDNITRVAAIIHTFEGYEGDIDTSLLEYAWRLCNGYSNHFIQYMAGDPEIVTLTNQLVRDIRRLGENHQNGKYLFKKAKVSQRGGGRYIREPKHLNAAIKLLTQLGHLEENGRGNFRFSETIVGITDPHFKNGVDYHVEEILRYDEQENYSENGGRYAGFRQKL
ncbi:YfjI family protein [Vreelandella titanicae]|uniref:YfjI family protein n=1 Tax=Vreelandella titanicae TaxID=664683 RepID=UPI003D2B38F0